MSIPVYAQRGHDRQHENQGKGRGQQERGDRRERPQREQRAQQSREQQPQQQRAREVQHQGKPEQARRQPAPPPHRTEREAAAWQKQQGWLRPGAWKGRGTWQQNRAQHWTIEHRTWVQRGGYGGYYIPHDRFVVHFGPQHWFRIRTRPVIYMGYPRFSYSGFSFLLVDPWPETWAETWYDSDDVYIDYDDGYYLYNRRHPGIALAITVVM
jgi:hypothetical protein